MITVKLFGIAKEIVGNNKLEISAHLLSVQELLDYLKSEYPRFTKLNSLLVAVNSEYAENDSPISSKDEIAIIPPVSGG